ncbi:MAG: exo-alpha-sialidase, partial [Elusimicrobia bacterium]|nr:exo-alpha-sialidase [Elusimicrobiota bacterium]
GDAIYAAWHVEEGLLPWIAFRRSLDRGKTWEPERRVSPRAMPSAHPSLAAAGGRVHIVFVEGLPRAASRVRYARSTDAGASWDEPRGLSEDPDAAWVPTVAAAGSRLYAAWVGTGAGNEEEYFRASSDGGRTWGAILRMTSHAGNSWAPSLAADGDVVHMAWFDQKDNARTPREVERTLGEITRLVGLEPGPELPPGVLIPDPEGGAKLRTQLKAQRIATEAPGWAERGGDVRRLSACMDRLESAGRKGAPYSEKERLVDECLAIAGIAYRPDVRGEGERVFYLDAIGPKVRKEMERVQRAAPEWVARGGDPKRVEEAFRRFERAMHEAVTEWEVYYRRSDDGGATWGPEIRLTRSPGLSHRPSIAAAGRTVHVAWFDGRDGDTEIYYKASADGGRTWTPDLRLTEARGASTLPSLAADARGAHVLWVDERGGKPAIYYRRTDSGDTGLLSGLAR